MDLVDFFLDLHAASHAGEVSGATTGSARWLSGLPGAQMRLRPRPGVNSLVWLLWHMARTEDVAVNLVVAGRAQVFDDDWARRMRVPRRDLGTGMTVDEVAELSEGADVAAVRTYRSAVGIRTREVVRTLGRAAWDETLGLEDHRPWQGHRRGHQLGQTAIRHNAAHIGEAVTVRGLAGLGLGI